MARLEGAVVALGRIASHVSNCVHNAPRDVDGASRRSRERVFQARDQEQDGELGVVLQGVGVGALKAA